MVGAKGLGDEARQAKWTPKGHSRRRAQARGHSAPHVDRPNRIQLVEEGGCRVTSNNGSKTSRSTAGKDVPAGTMAVVRSPDFLRALNQRDCACNIDPSASSYAIMRRAAPTAERTVGPARMIAESLTPKPGIREHNQKQSGQRHAIALFAARHQNHLPASAETSNISELIR